MKFLQTQAYIICAHVHQKSLKGALSAASVEVTLLDSASIATVPATDDNVLDTFLN